MEREIKNPLALVQLTQISANILFNRQAVLLFASFALCWKIISTHWRELWIKHRFRQLHLILFFYCLKPRLLRDQGKLCAGQIGLGILEWQNSKSPFQKSVCFIIESSLQVGHHSLEKCIVGAQDIRLTQARADNMTAQQAVLHNCLSLMNL